LYVNEFEFWHDFSCDTAWLPVTGAARLLLNSAVSIDIKSLWLTCT